MDDAEHAIAVLDGVDEHAQRRQIVDLADVLLIALHLLVDAVEMLGTPLDFCRYMRLFKLFHDLLVRLVDECLTLLALLLDALDEIVVRLGLEIAQAQILKFPLDVRYAEAIRERRVDLDGLPRDALLLVLAHVLERAHIVQTVGELDHDDADVLRHREKHLAIAFELLLFLRLILNPAELRHAVDEHRDLIAEALAHFVERMRRIFHDIMQDGGADRDVVDLQIRQNLRDGQRMDDVVFTRNALLSLVCGIRKFVRPSDEVGVRIRLIALDRFQDHIDRHGTHFTHCTPPGFPRHFTGKRPCSPTLISYYTLYTIAQGLNKARYLTADSLHERCATSASQASLAAGRAHIVRRQAAGRRVLQKSAALFET